MGVGVVCGVVVRCSGVVRYGCGVVWCGAVVCGVARCGGVVRYGWCGVVQYGWSAVWCGVVGCSCSVVGPHTNIQGGSILHALKVYHQHLYCRFDDRALLPKICYLPRSVREKEKKKGEGGGGNKQRKEERKLTMLF